MNHFKVLQGRIQICLTFLEVSRTGEIWALNAIVKGKNSE